jgi:hypothetical protein
MGPGHNIFLIWRGIKREDVELLNLICKLGYKNVDKTDIK